MLVMDGLILLAIIGLYKFIESYWDEPPHFVTDPQYYSYWKHEMKKQKMRAEKEKRKAEKENGN